MTLPEALDVPTRRGRGIWHIRQPVPSCPVRGHVLLGHGAGGGVDAHDLLLLTRELTLAGFLVARFEQPWRVAGRRVATPPLQLDEAWLDAVNVLEQRLPNAPLVIGGRSAGARVACRTSRSIGPDGVLALAFPLHPPARTSSSRAEELQVRARLLVIQGEVDPMGTATHVRSVVPPSGEVATVPGADHALRRRGASPLTQRETDEIIARSALRWLRDVVLSRPSQRSAG